MKYLPDHGEVPLMKLYMNTHTIKTFVQRLKKLERNFIT